ncbi:MAG: TPM domain-containing protein [Deltaproteobacteria bacterium]|nr:TPM domain-containing protein [Deltaproteobacteria bacterium]MBN2687763.1 TPM domain-containing protein [Deltaproteobacteria bacterium]
MNHRNSTMLFVISLAVATFAMFLFSNLSLSLETPLDFIDDRPGLLTEQEKDRINQLHRALLNDLDIHIKVIILGTGSSDIDREAVRLFQDHALGATTRGSKGILLLIDPAGQQVRMEIGYDLEHIYTDGFIGYIERKQMVPFFQSGRVGPGIEATVEFLAGKAFGAVDESAYAIHEERPRVGDHLSGGAGAHTDITIGSGAPRKDSTQLASQFGPRDTPEETLNRYLTVLRLHIKDPLLGIYTPETRIFFSKWIVTDAQQDNQLISLEKLIDQGTAFRSGNRAVIRFPLSNRQASPYFFRRGPEGWMLDFASMNRCIRFNHRNQWFFSEKHHDFMFAFEDVFLDKNGFPHSKRKER